MLDAIGDTALVRLAKLTPTNAVVQSYRRQQRMGISPPVHIRQP